MNNKQNKNLAANNFEYENVQEAKSNLREQNYPEPKKRVRISCSRLLGCGCLIFLVLCLLSIYVIIAKPTFIWHPIVDFVNAGEEFPQYSEKSEQEAQSGIADQIKSIGENELYITEDQLTALLRPTMANFKDLTIELEEGKIIAYWKLDHSEKPVFGIAEIRLNENGEPEITKVGTPRIALPEFANKATTNVIKSLLKINNSNILGSIITSGEDIKLKNIEILQDKIRLKLNVNINLFSE